MNLRLIAVLAGIFLASGKCAYAEPHVALRDVVQKAVLNNPEVLSRWHAFRSAGGDVDTARGAFFPKIDVTAGLGKEELTQSGLGRSFDRSGASLTLNQMLFDGFATARDVQRLDRARLTRYFELVEAAENTALEAGKAYLDVIRYRNLTFLAENNYVEHRIFHEQILRRVQTGVGRRADLELASSRLALSEFNLNTEAANLHDVSSRYIRLVGEAPPKVMFPPARLGDAFPGGETEALEQAFRANPTLRAAVENIEAAQHELDARRSAFSPRVDLRLRNDNNRNYLGVPGLRVDNVAEVVLSYNLFNGGSDGARQRAAAERKNQAFDLRDKACRDIRQTLSIAYNDVRRLKAQLGNLDIQVHSMEQARNAYRDQFDIAQRSLLDLLDTENELLSVRRTAVNIDVDLAIAFLRTHAGIGRLLDFFGLKRVEGDEAPKAKEMTPVVASEICPPEAPVSYGVDFKALTDRAMRQLDTVRSRGVQSSPAIPGGAGQNAPAGIPATIKKEAPAQPDATEKVLRERISAWAAAWSARDYAAYRAFYAPSFMPSDGTDIDTWSKQREARLARAKQIEVEVKSLRFGNAVQNAVSAEFEQRYVADNYRDTTVKILQWKKIGDIWLIERETAKPLPERASGSANAGSMSTPGAATGKVQ